MGSLLLRTTTFSLLLVALVSASRGSERFVVIANDPNGRGDELASTVAGKMRGAGIDAVWAHAPAAFERLRDQDALARRLGATRVVVLDLKATRHRDTVRGGGTQKSYPPTLRVWRFDVGLVNQPIEPRNELGPPGATGPPAEAQGLRDQAPIYPSTATTVPQTIREEVRAGTRVTMRAVGAREARLDTRVGTGAMIGFTTQNTTESQEASARMENLWGRVFGEIADQTAELIARRE